MGNNESRQTSLAECLIKKLGNKSPNKKQIKLMESLIFNTRIVVKKVFDNRLTQREIDCLVLASLGETSGSTADILEISRKTVDQYKRNLRTKLGSRNMVEAAIQGIKYAYLYQSNKT